MRKDNAEEGYRRLLECKNNIEDVFMSWRCDRKRDLGKGAARKAKKMKLFDPDETWEEVEEQ